MTIKRTFRGQFGDIERKIRRQRTIRTVRGQFRDILGTVSGQQITIRGQLEDNYLTIRGHLMKYQKTQDNQSKIRGHFKENQKTIVGQYRDNQRINQRTIRRIYININLYIYLSISDNPLQLHHVSGSVHSEHSAYTEGTQPAILID